MSSDRNRAESIRHRLRNVLRQRGDDAQFGLQRYAAERFLYRLGESPHRERYVLKGAALFALWGGTLYRATRDLDFTGFGSPDRDRVLAAMAEVCTVPGCGDGLTFDPRTLSAEPIRDDSEYAGLRLRLEARLGGSRIPVQIDVGFGNAILPAPSLVWYPTLLDDPPPRILAYPLEAVIAEKLHAMVLLGERNSRFKDFYDLYVLAGQFEFDGEVLARAVAATFERRRTVVGGPMPAPLAPAFFADDDRAAQWRAYLGRNGLPGAPADFAGVGEVVAAFLAPVWKALEAPFSPSPQWQRGGGWEGHHAAVPTPAARSGTNQAGPSARGGGAALQRLARRFKPYPAYKDSGVEWLGKIPAHWEVWRLRSTLTGCQNGVWGDEPDGLHDIACVRVADFDRVRFRVDMVDPTLRSIEQHVVSAHGLHAGDLLLEKSGGGENQPVGAVVLYDHDIPAVCSNFIARVTVGDGHDPRFLTYLHAALYAMRINTRHIKQSTGIQNLDSASYLSEAAAFPDTAEQRAIAAFLDRETARIDALVAKKERLIQLLQEKRTALITRAMTKGLDPIVPMKDSGVEWLGEIPARWMVKRVRQSCSQVTDGAHISPDTSSADFPFVSTVDIREGAIDFDGCLRTSASSYAYMERTGCRPKLGDVLFSKDGTVGTTAVVATDREFAVASSLVILSPDQVELDARWLDYWLNGLFVKDHVKLLLSGAALRRISVAKVGRLPLLLPPGLEEQRAIAAFLDRETAKIDALIAKIGEAIHRLKELRTALIAAAVTGKIDVREEAA